MADQLTHWEQQRRPETPRVSYNDSSNPYDLSRQVRKGMNPIDRCDNPYDLTHVSEMRRRAQGGRNVR